MTRYTDESSYLEDVKGRSALPRGFRCGSASLSFVPPELGKNTAMRMNLAAVVLDEPSACFAAVLTRNRFPGHPVTIARRRLAEPRVRGVLANNKVSNVCTPGGEEDAERLLSLWGTGLGSRNEELFSASTGVIGWKLPVREMAEALPVLEGSLQPVSAFPVAEAIMTTDSFPKLRSASVGNGRIVAVAKGAGMIEPAMATLLVFIMTDCSIPRAAARSAVSRVMDRTFNCISIDGDQSTSDMALLFSSGRAEPVGEDEFERALLSVCAPLAEDVVRNGEGTRHVIVTEVTGAPDERIAAGVAKAVINSPLVKTAVCGNDPNVGRIIGAVGDYLGNESVNLDTTRTVVSIGGETVFADGRFRLTAATEKAVSAHLASAELDPHGRFPAHDQNVEIRIELGSGDGRRRVIGSDLTHEYVSENADYRS